MYVLSVNASQQREGAPRTRAAHHYCWAITLISMPPLLLPHSLGMRHLCSKIFEPALYTITTGFTHKHYVCSTHKMLITQASIPSSYADSEWDIYYDILNWFILSGKLSTNTGSGSLTDSTTTYFWFWSWIAHSWNQLWRRSLPKIKLKIWAAGSWSLWAHHQQRN